MKTFHREKEIFPVLLFGRELAMIAIAVPKVSDSLSRLRLVTII
jgi:hypothetical protein